MKSIKWATAFLLLTAAIGNAWADRGYGHGHGHGSIGVVIGPYWGPGYYGSPFYYPPYSPSLPYYPPVVVERVDPPVYVEQRRILPEVNEVLPALPQPGFWYYCQAAQGYYPYVRECPAGWQKVAPQPSSKP
jgi:hypothetical protein